MLPLFVSLFENKPTHRVLLAISWGGFITSLLQHVASYYYQFTLEHVGWWLFIITLTAIASLAANPAYWHFYQNIYAYFGWEWKLTSAMTLQEKHRHWRIMLTAWKAEYAHIGMPCSPSWMRSLAFPVLYLGLSAMLVTAFWRAAVVISRVVPLVVAAIFFHNLTIYTSSVREDWNEDTDGHD